MFSFSIKFALNILLSHTFLDTYLFANVLKGKQRNTPVVNVMSWK